MSTLAELSIFPLDQGEHLSNHVAKAVSVIKNSGLSYELGPMGTTIEGDTESILRIIQQCVTTLEKDSNRVYMTLKLDITKGKENRLKGKVTSVLEKL